MPQFNEEWQNYLNSSQSDIDMQLLGDELFAYVLKRVVSSYEQPKKEQMDTIINIYNSFFFSKGRLLYFWNSYEIILEESDVEQLLKLYLYSKKLDNKDYLLISEFIISASYHAPINSKQEQFMGEDAYPEISIGWWIDKNN